LRENVETDSDPANFFSGTFWALDCFARHCSKPPLAGLERLMCERQHHDSHAHVEDDWPCIYYDTRKCSHVLERREVAQQIACLGAYIEQNELNQAEEKQQRNRTKGNDSRDDLVSGQ